jgi:hypothetical protein
MVLPLLLPSSSFFSESNKHLCACKVRRNPKYKAKVAEEKKGKRKGKVEEYAYREEGRRRRNRKGEEAYRKKGSPRGVNTFHLGNR